MALIIFIAITIGVTLAYKRFSEGWKRDNPGQPVFQWKSPEETKNQPSIDVGGIPGRSDGLISSFGGDIDPTNNGGTYQ